MVEDNKDGIISDIRQAISKRKVVLAMGEASANVVNIGRRVQSRCNFTCLLNSISSTPEAVVVIPDNGVQQSEGERGAIKQPVVPVSQPLFDLSPPRGSRDVALHQTPPREEFTGIIIHPVFLFLLGI